MLTNDLNNTRTYKGNGFSIEIDGKAGFCFGVTQAIKKVEDHLAKGEKVYSLGDVVHNSNEIKRLEGNGMSTLSYQEFGTIKSKNVLFRAHGEPPESYAIAKANKIEVTDGTCPVVLKLQQRIHKAWELMKPINGQIVLFGKKGHAEVIGLLGQTNNEAIVVSSIDDICSIDFSRAIELFSQTTSSVSAYKYLIDQLQKKAKASFKANDTICRQVSDREPWLKKFVKNFDVFVFVGGAKSSNAKFLFQVCKDENPETHLIADSSELNFDWFRQKRKIGISGATSTPLWLMQEVAETIFNKINGSNDINFQIK